MTRKAKIRLHMWICVILQLYIGDEAKIVASYQTSKTCRLSWIVYWSRYHIIGFAMLWLTIEVFCLKITESPTRLEPFYTSSCGPASEEFAVLTVDNILLAGSQFGGQHTKTSLQFSAQLMLDVLEYKMLTMQKLLIPCDISGVASVQPTPKVGWFTVLFHGSQLRSQHIKPVSVHFSAKLILYLLGYIVLTVQRILRQWYFLCGQVSA